MDSIKLYRNILIVFILLFGLMSCKSSKVSGDTVYKKIDGYQFVENKKHDFSIKYPADYWFHPLSKKSMLNRDDDFIGSLSLVKIKNGIVLNGHTIHQPYFSTLGIVYENENVRDVVNEVKRSLTSIDKFSIGESNEILPDGKTFFKLTYELEDKNLRISRRYAEYLTNHNKKTLRIVFWTSATNEDTMEIEAKSIVEAINNIGQL